MISIFLKQISMVFKIYILFIMTWYMPFSYTVKNSNMSLALDLFFLYLLIQSLLLSRTKLIFIGLLIGFFMDIVSPEKRSQMMSSIRNKNTKPEIIVRKIIFIKSN